MTKKCSGLGKAAMSMKVSVLIDTYNHEKYIRAAIDSVLEQQGVLNETVEIIVIDDGSTDKTGEIVREYGDVLRYYRKPNGGQASAFNMGIRICEGEIICFLDGDDWWHPTKLKVILNTFSDNPTTCAVGHAFVEVDEVGDKCFSVGPKHRISVKYDSLDSIALFHRFACCLGTSRLAIRRSIAIDLLDVPELLVFEADEYLFTLLPTTGNVIILPDVLTYYRIHGANLFQDSRATLLRHQSEDRLFKRAAIYECLSSTLPVELTKRGCSLSTVKLLLRPIEIQASRLKLMSRGGTPLENFRSEWRAAQLFERTGKISRIMLYVSLALTLICPPKSYFRIRQAYANVRRLVGQFRHQSLSSSSHSSAP